MSVSEKDIGPARQYPLKDSDCSTTPAGIVKGMTDQEAKSRGEHFWGIEGWKGWREEWINAGQELRKRKEKKKK